MTSSPSHEPLVSVIVPTRNRSNLLEPTVSAILAQEHSRIELIVVDDYSDDDTAGRVRGLGDARVRLIRLDQNVGVAGARNAGASAASGRWLAFCDDDDLWVPAKLRLQLAALEATGASWCFGDAVIVDDRLDPLQVVRAPAAATLSDLSNRNVVPGGGSGVVVDRAAFEQVGGFDPTLSMFADWELWIRLAGSHPDPRSSTSRCCST